MGDQKGDYNDVFREKKSVYVSIEIVKTKYFTHISNK